MSEEETVKIQQIAIQIGTAPKGEERVLIQTGGDRTQPDVKVILYSELTNAQALIWDNFVEMTTNLK